MSIKKMEEMTWKEFDKLDKEITVIIVDEKIYNVWRKCFRENGIIEGYVGSPAKASFEYGQKQFKNMITQTGNLIIRFLEDGYIPEISSGIKKKD